MKMHLLEYIYENSDVEFLSDLRVKSMLKNSISFIQNIPDTQFSLEDWKYFYLYLTNQKSQSNTIVDVKSDIMTWISKAG